MTRGRLPASVIALGVVSLLMDMSSELIHALLPVFLVTSLGASMVTVGLIEGLAEATAHLLKVFSGALSDYWRKRKPLILAGYGLAALTKPFFPLATMPVHILAARLIDRVGKGIRGAPRDALIADVTPESLRGSAYGLRQSMDTMGAVLGPLAALGLMALLNDDIRAVFWVAGVPAALAIAVILIWVREPPRVQAPDDGREAAPRRFPLSRGALKQLPRTFVPLLVLAFLVHLARFSEAFLILRVQEAGLKLGWIPLVLIVMNISYTLSAWPLGRLADRWPPGRVLALGMGLLVVADLMLALGSGLPALFGGILVWGVHMGATQGVLSAMVAAEAPAGLRGTAFGLYNLVTGAALLLASVIAGGLWSSAGSTFTFVAGAMLAGLAMLWQWRVARAA
ncbi:MFS transporter [Hahella sp. SMD15-11]|uniref:MFS transporter n=1 Tax=Thermohahella caldifontis TaxID=3142973 RepID=A0AB39UWF3_9GAMM